MKLTEKQQLVGILVVAGALVVGEVVFAFMGNSQREELQSELSSLDDRQRVAQAKCDRIPDLEAKVRELSDIVDQYTEILPREDEVSPDAFLDDISRLCSEVGLEIASANPIEVKDTTKAPRRTGNRNTPAPKNQPKSFVQHKYRFEMAGSFPALLQFLNGVENHTRFLQVDELSVENLASGRAGSAVEAALDPRKSLVVELSTYTYSATPVPEEVTQ
jgi:Tfp pilus assembly protein PilO